MVLMRTTALGCCLLPVVVTACGGGGAATQADAKKTAAALAGKDQVAPVNNPQCKLFAPAELAKFVGWNAGAITGAEAVVVSVEGPAANEATAIGLLKETIARRSR